MPNLCDNCIKMSTSFTLPTEKKIVKGCRSHSWLSGSLACGAQLLLSILPSQSVAGPCFHKNKANLSSLDLQRTYATCQYLDKTHLDERAFFGMKAKSRRGKNSLGPMMPNPFVRFAWSLGGEIHRFLRTNLFNLHIKFCYCEIHNSLSSLLPIWGNSECIFLFYIDVHIKKRDLQKKPFQICNSVWGQGLKS